MAERDKTGQSSGTGSGPKAPLANFPSSPECGQWETLLVDAMDGALRPEDEATFSNHMATCSACTEMFEQVRRGREWLEFLAPEPQVPVDLLARILTETARHKMEPGTVALAGGTPAAVDNIVLMTPHWQRPGFTGRLRRFAEPRLLMTAAMAFFSIALTLSLTGVHISAVRLSDLRPAALRSVVEKRIMTASTPIVRYYDHLRFVYEVESRMRELRRSTQSPEGTAAPKSGASGQAGQQPGDGESRRKDGGSKLNPKDAPQQTVNPPALWSTDFLQASLHTTPTLNLYPHQDLSPDRLPRSMPGKTLPDQSISGSSPHTPSGPRLDRQASNPDRAPASVTAASERSIVCLA